MLTELLESQKEQKAYAEYVKGLSALKELLKLPEIPKTDIPCWFEFEGERDWIYVDSVTLKVMPNDRIELTYAVSTHDLTHRLTEANLQIDPMEPDGYPDHVLHIYWEKTGESPDEGTLSIHTDFNTDSAIGRQLFESIEIEPVLRSAWHSVTAGSWMFLITVELSPCTDTPLQQRKLFKRDFPFKSKPVNVDISHVEGIINRVMLEDMETRIKTYLEEGEKLHREILEFLRKNETQGGC